MSMCTFVYSLAAKCQRHISLSSERRNHDQSQIRMRPCVTSSKLTFNNTDYYENSPVFGENIEFWYFVINILLCNEFETGQRHTSVVSRVASSTWS